MSDSDNEWGFFVDLENYSKHPTSKPFYKYIPERKLYTIQESEEIYYNSELKEPRDIYYNSELKEPRDIYYNSELKEPDEPERVKEKIQYYVSLGIMITGFATTILFAYYDII
jgi:hypothetical protein